MSLLRATGLRHRYAQGLLGRGRTAPALDGVDLELHAGEVVGLLGESGCGKTTLLRVLLGLVVPEEGEVEVLGRSWGQLRGRARDRFRRQVQPLFQDAAAHLDPAMSVQALLRESARLHRPGEPVDALVDDALARVGLRHRIDALPHQLSGGEQRRAGIARLLLCRPRLILADEPTAGLDAARKPGVLALLRDVALTPDDGTPDDGAPDDGAPDDGAGGDRALLVVSHDLAVLAGAADRLVVMVSGRVVEDLPVAALAEGPHHPHTAALLHAAGLRSEAPPARPGGIAGTSGCPLADRCDLALPRCAAERPLLRRAGPHHHIACHALPSESTP